MRAEFEFAQGRTRSIAQRLSCCAHKSLNDFRASFEQGGTPCVRQVRPQNDLEPRSDSIRSEKALRSACKPTHARATGDTGRGPITPKSRTRPGISRARPVKRTGVQRGKPLCKKKKNSSLPAPCTPPHATHTPLARPFHHACGGRAAPWLM